MNVLMVLGSPRKKGNSETLCNSIISGIEEKIDCSVESLYLHGRDISPCRGCGGCEKTGKCVIKDELTDIYDKVDHADVIFLVTPVYFYGPTAQLKTFIDRFQAKWSRKYLLNTRHRIDHKRQGYLVSTAATKGKKVFDASILIAKSFFDTIDMPYGGECLVRSVDERGAVAAKEDELQKAIDLGRKIGGDFSDTDSL